MMTQTFLVSRALHVGESLCRLLSTSSMLLYTRDNAEAVNASLEQNDYITRISEEQ